MKKNMFKRVIALSLAGVMALAPLTYASASDGDVEVEELYWFSDVSGWGPNSTDWPDGGTPSTQYLEEEIGLKINLEQPPTDASTKLGLMIATGDLPDLMSITDNDIYNQLVEADLVWDMQEFLETYAPDSHLLTDFPEDMKQQLIDTYGGWYSYPSHANSMDSYETFPPDDDMWMNVKMNGNNMCIMFNTEIMDALGITEDDVKTESGFLEACEKVKNSGYEVDGQSVLPVVLHCDTWINQSLDGILAGNFGAVCVDEDGNYRHTELSPGYYYALKFINELIRNGYLDVNILTIDETAMLTYLDSKRVFCWIGNQAQQDKTDMPWVSYGPILADNGATPVIGIDQSAGTGWIQTLVSKDCSCPEKIAEYLTWISSEEGMMLEYYGNEGEDYTVDENGVVYTADDYEDRVSMMWPWANTAFERHTEPVPDPSSNRGVEVALMPAFAENENTYVYDSSVLNFLNGTVIEPSSDLGIKLSQVDNYLESQKAKIVTASTDEEFEAEYQNMLDTLESYDIAEIDAAYDVYYKAACEQNGTSIEDVNASLYE